MFVYFLVFFNIFLLSILMVIISLELTRVNPDRNIFSINVELTSTFLLYRGLVNHHHRILNGIIVVAFLYNKTRLLDFYLLIVALHVVIFMVLWTKQKWSQIFLFKFALHMSKIFLLRNFSSLFIHKSSLRCIFRFISSTGPIFT